MEARRYVDPITQAHMIEFTMAFSVELINDLNSMNGVDVNTELGRVIVEDIKDCLKTLPPLGA